MQGKCRFGAEEAPKTEGKCKFGVEEALKTQGKCRFGAHRRSQCKENNGLERRGPENVRKMWVWAAEAFKTERKLEFGSVPFRTAPPPSLLSAFVGS